MVHRPGDPGVERPIVIALLRVHDSEALAAGSDVGIGIRANTNVRVTAAETSDNSSAAIAAQEIDFVLHEQAAGDVARPIGVERALLNRRTGHGIGLVAQRIHMLVVDLAAEDHALARSDLRPTLQHVAERVDRDVVPNDRVGRAKILPDGPVSLSIDGERAAQPVKAPKPEPFVPARKRAAAPAGRSPIASDRARPRDPCTLARAAARFVDTRQ